MLNPAQNLYSHDRKGQHTSPPFILPFPASAPQRTNGGIAYHHAGSKMAPPVSQTMPMVSLIFDAQAVASRSTGGDAFILLSSFRCF
jgi:hypothetical protein